MPYLAKEVLETCLKDYIPLFTDGPVDPTHGTAAATYGCPFLEIEKSTRIKFRDTATSTDICAIWFSLKCLVRQSSPRKVANLTNPPSALALLSNDNASALLARTVANALREMQTVAGTFSFSGCLLTLASLATRWLMH